MTVTKSYRQGIGNIVRLRHLSQSKNSPNHKLNLLLGGPALSGRGLLHLQRGVLENCSTDLGRRQEGYTPGLTHYESGGHIAVEKQLLHSCFLYLVSPKYVSQLMKKEP
jgi:hypothetical protein